MGGWPAEGSISKLFVDQNLNTSDDAVNDMGEWLWIAGSGSLIVNEQTNKQTNKQTSKFEDMGEWLWIAGSGSATRSLNCNSHPTPVCRRIEESSTISTSRISPEICVSNIAIYAHIQNIYCPERWHLVLSKPDRARFGLDLYHQPAIIGWGVWPVLPANFHTFAPKVMAASAPISHLTFQWVSPDYTGLLFQFSN